MKKSLKEVVLSKIKTHDRVITPQGEKYWERVSKGLCPCGNTPREGKRRCAPCAEKRSQWYKRSPEAYLSRSKYAYQMRKDKIFEHYGRICVCCGEDYPPFLCLDHVKGGGHQHQAEVGRGTNYYQWIIDNGYPEGMFQVLCANCNQAKGTKDRCHCQDGYPTSSSPSAAG